MTYTLAMAADQGIRIAEDGVAEVSMTDARANLTQLIRDVRYGGRSAAFTERSKRVAAVVPLEDYGTLRELRAYLEELRAGDTADAKHKARVLDEALALAKYRALDSG